MDVPATTADTKRPGRPTRGDSNVRDRLIDAATGLAIERGFDAAGIREIADRAGVSSGMISYYFGDRRGLYEAMFERATGRLSNQLSAALNTLPSGADAIETMIRLHSAALAADPWIPQLLAREVLAKEGNLRTSFAERVGEGPLRLMLEAIEEAIERGVLRSDLDPALCVLSLASMSVFPYLVAPVLGDQLGIVLDDDFRRRLVEHNLALIARGLRAREEEIS